MASNEAKLPPLYFSREQFAYYWTSLISRIRQDDHCDKVYTGLMPHPLISLQQKSQQQIIDYQLTLLPEALLQQNPIEPADRLIASIIVAATARRNDPPLQTDWEAFDKAWPIYKRALRHIYALVVATLRVGSSMHYARSVAYGSGLHLLNTIRADNK